MLIIKKLRLQKGWSQAELAQFSGLSVRTIQRVEKGDKPGLETLKCLAAVFDLEAADFQQEVEFMEKNEVSEEERKAFKHVQDLKGFYGNLITYVIVITGLFIINLISSPEYIWAKWPAMGWGIGILAHGLRAFDLFTLFGPEWEKKQVEKRLGRTL
jgi:transcriptional regulator with XRE-family HTH domain